MPPQGSRLLSLKPKLSAVSSPQARAEVKEPLRVFADTGVLLAMILFPKDRKGHRTLAGEVGSPAGPPQRRSKPLSRRRPIPQMRPSSPRLSRLSPSPI